MTHTGRWKLIDSPERDRRELYDLEAEPDEANDAIYREPGVAGRLQARLDEWLEHYRAPAAPSALGEEEHRAMENLGCLE